MEYKDTVRDYLNRCKENLKIVEGNGGYEATQLVSNFISCLIFVKENILIDEDPIDKHGLECNIMYDDYKVKFKNNTRYFITHLRNACCHYGIEIKPKKGQIYKIVFRDIHCKDKKQKCKFELTISQIEVVYKYLLGLL